MTERPATTDINTMFDSAAQETITRLRDENRKLRMAIERLNVLVEGIAQQQAMSDDSYKTELEAIRRSISND